MMIKPLFLFILCLLVAGAAFAQKRDTSVYFLNTGGRVVSTKDSADFILLILPPDTVVDKNLFIVEEFYKNGKRRLITGSRTNDLNMKLQGLFIGFFPNGHRMKVSNYENGEPVGDQIEYYPNGKFYNKKSYVKTFTEETELLLKDCKDSTGNVLAEGGNGKWIKFDSSFEKIEEEGQIENGHEEGAWRSKISDTVFLVNEYKNGIKVSSKTLDKAGKEIKDPRIFTSVDQVPEFPGGLDEFMRLLVRHLDYPARARENGTQGRVIICFIVEKDGSLTDIKVVRGIGDGCDEEAVRVIKLSPRWKPGMQNGHAVRVAYSVPISFSLGK
ncbi:MAG: TonB family protein [Sphingobacteriales bacterium]